MEIEFKIKNDMLVLENQKKTVSGNVNFYKCRFEILTNKELVWICVFKKHDKVYQQVIEDGACVIPAEVLLDGGILEIGCYASRNSEKFQRISTNWVQLEVSSGAYSEGTAPKIPEKDVWETLVLKNIPYIGENGNWYIFDTEKMEYVDSKRSSLGEKGEKGDRGEMGVPGTANAANALKGNRSGTDVVLTDVSPIEHIPDVKVKSKNMVERTGYNNGTPGMQTALVTAVLGMPLEKGKTYTASWQTENTGAEKCYFSLVAGKRVDLKRSPSLECNGERKYYTFQMTETVGKPSGTALQTSPTNTVNSGLCSDFMIEEGEVVTEYTPYINDLSSIPIEVIDAKGQNKEFVSDAEGIVGGVVSCYPEMGITVKKNGVILDVTYNRDINKVFAELEEKLANAIISLGGNV